VSSGEGVDEVILTDGWPIEDIAFCATSQVRNGHVHLVFFLLSNMGQIECRYMVSRIIVFGCCLTIQFVTIEQDIEACTQAT